MTLDEKFVFESCVKFEGHSEWVNDILLLPSLNQAITCSNDTTIKVWDCETGVCLRTLTQHTQDVKALAVSASGQVFASGSYDQTVIIWSIESLESLRKVNFSSLIQSLVSRDTDTLRVFNQGVKLCNVYTGQTGPLEIPGTGSITCLASGLCHFVWFCIQPASIIKFPQCMRLSPGLRRLMHCGLRARSKVCHWLLQSYGRHEHDAGRWLCPTSL
jgi:WD40 repeat protein